MLLFSTFFIVHTLFLAVICLNKRGKRAWTVEEYLKSLDLDPKTDHIAMVLIILKRVDYVCETINY